MNRSSDPTRVDWLRPSRLYVPASERPTLIKECTHPDARDLRRSLAASMLLGLLVGAITFLAIATG